jgi:hypothetical protein
MSAITRISSNIPHSHTLLCTPRFELRLRLELLLILVDRLLLVLLLLLLALASPDALLDEKRPGELLIR